MDSNRLARLASLEGLISAEVGLKLAELASRVPAGQVIVEIGSYKGKSACYLGEGSRSGAGVMVYAIDPWDLKGNIGGRFGFDQRSVRADFATQVTLCELQDFVQPVQAFSQDAARIWKRPIGLLYIDGSHTEKDVRADWNAWKRHLSPGAVVAFDDYDTPRNPGVKRVVDELVQTESRRWEFGPAPLAIGYPL